MADEPRPPAVAKTEVWTLGLLGVNVVDGALHLVDGELLAAQNAEPFMEEGEGGIRKRLGIALFTPEQLAAGISAITSIPLPDPFIPYPTEGELLFAVTSTDGGTPQYYQTSEDGITWDDSGGLGFGKFNHGGNSDFNYALQHGGTLTTDEGLYFLAAAAGVLVRWDGNAAADVTSNALSDVSSMTICSTLLVHAGEIYAIGRNAGGTALYICRLAGTAWEEVVAVASWDDVQAACSAFGRIYVPSSGQKMGYWSADSGWVDEGIFTGNVGATMPATDMVATLWGLIVTLDCNGQDPELVWLRAGPDDAWVDITPGGDVDSCWGPMALFNDVLYVVRQTDSLLGAFTGCEVWSYDGTTFALDEDLTGLASNVQFIAGMLVFNNVLYLVGRANSDPQSYIFRRTAAGAWTLPVSEIGISQSGLTGPIGFF